MKDNEIINELMTKIKKYKPSQDFQSCKVIFTMRSHIYLTHPWINFDSLIAYSCLKDILKTDFYKLPSKLPLDIYQNLQLPIKQSKGVYHTSISFFSNDNVNLDTIYKRFETNNLHHLTENKRKGKIRKGSGPFRDYMIKLPYIPTKSVTFYVNADIEELRHLLKNITNLGKKKSIGGGLIRDITINENEEDRSLIYENKAMRPLPVKEFGPGMKMVMLAYKFPYWDKQNVGMCIFPESELGLNA